MHLSTLFILLALAIASDATIRRERRRRASGFIRPDLSFLRDPYCSRPGLLQRDTCCEYRNDDCSRPIYGTLCYCDVFCDKEANDCCPDYYDVCRPAAATTEIPVEETTGSGEVPGPNELFSKQCPGTVKGAVLEDGENATDNCNLCTCYRDEATREMTTYCDQNTCLIRPTFISHHNTNGKGWKAANYSSAMGVPFYGKTLDWGMKHKLGVLKPKLTQVRTKYLGSFGRNIPRHYNLEDYDSLGQIVDQGDCGASWAYGVASMLTDKMIRNSAGRIKKQVSAQHLIDCNRRHQRGCEGGHIDGAIMFAKNRGVVSQDCYPEMKAQAAACPAGLRRVLTQRSVSCSYGNSTADDKPISVPIPYRVAQGRRIDVTNIQVEIMDRGSVLALMRVHSDLFMYRSGIYRHDAYQADAHPTAHHAVRIVGWGNDREGNKFWICANSWGTSWGENGYFRVVRGENHCDIEKYVIAIGNINYDHTLLSRRYSSLLRSTSLTKHRRHIRSVMKLYE